MGYFNNLPSKIGDDAYKNRQKQLNKKKVDLTPDSAIYSSNPLPFDVRNKDTSNLDAEQRRDSLGNTYRAAQYSYENDTDSTLKYLAKRAVLGVRAAFDNEANKKYGNYIGSQRENQYNASLAKSYADKIDYEKIKSNKELYGLLEQAYTADTNIYNTAKINKAQQNMTNNQSALVPATEQQQMYELNIAKDNALKKIEALGYESDKLFDFYTRQRNKEEAEYVVEKTKAFENEHPVLSNVLSVPGNLIGGVEGTKEKITNKLAGKENDPYSREQLLTNAVNAIREQSKENIRNDNADNFLGKEVKFGNVNLGTTGEMMYSAGMSAADNLMNMAAATVLTGGVGSALGVSSGLTAGAAGNGVKGVLGTLKNTSKAVEPVVLGLMSTNVYNNAYNENLIKGMSDSEAGIRAAISSGIEVLTEKIGMDKMIEGIGGNLSQIVLGAVAEGGEEVLSNMLNRLVDVIADGDESELQLRLQEYMSTYGDKTVAYEHLLSDILSEDLQAGIVGSLSGAMMSAPSVAGLASSKVNESRFNRYTGEDIVNNGNSYNILEMGRSSQNSDIQKLAEKAVAAKGKKTLTALGKLANAMSDNYSSSANQDAYTAVKSSVNEFLTNDGKSFNSADKIASAVAESVINGKESKNKQVNKFVDEINSNETPFAKQINRRISLIDDDADFKQQYLGSALYGKQSSLDYFAQSNGYKKVDDYYTNREYAKDYTVKVDDKDVKVNSAKPISYENGVANINIVDGNKIKTVPANEVLNTMSSKGNKQVLQAVLNSSAGELGTNTIIVNYQGQTALNYASPNAYVKDAELIYSYGRLYPHKSFDDVVNMKGMPIGENALLSDVAKNIFTSGQTDALNQDSTKKQKEYVKAEKTDKQGTFTDNADVDDDTSKMMKIQSKALGIEIEAVSDGRDSSTNGSYTPSIAKVILNMSENKRNWFTTNIHELVHFTKQNAAKAYERLENHIIDWFLSENNLGGYESAVEAYMRTYSKNNPNFTRADAKEEITADSISALFSTKDGIKEFVHYVTDKYKQNAKAILDTFEEWINNIITSINTMLKKDVLSPLQRSVLQIDKQKATDIRKEFLSALDEAIKNYNASKSEQKNNTADSDVKNSIKYPKYTEKQLRDNAKFVSEMDSVISLSGNEFDGKEKTSEKIDNFFNSLNNKIYSEEYGDISLNKASRRSEIRHGSTRLKIASYKAIPNVIKSGKTVYMYNKNYVERIVIAAPIEIANERYYMGVMLQRDNQSQRLYLHDVIAEKETALSTDDDLNTTGSPKDNNNLFLTNILQNVLSVNSNNMHENEKYSFNVSGGNGYDGYSMSNNARNAYDDGEKPMSKWRKADIIDAIRTIDPEKAGLLSKVNVKTLKDVVLTKTSWHHTSEYYNKTDFYSVDEDKVANLTKKQIKDLVAEKNEKPLNNTFRGDITYLEWSGTRKHPKSEKIELKDVNIEERGSFYIVTDDLGNELIRKKIGSNGTSVVDYEREKRKKLEQERIQNELKQSVKENSSKEAYELYKDMLDKGLTYSSSGNIYYNGRKPSRSDYLLGLDKFFKEGEKRLTPNYDGGYIVETWNGEEWITSDNVNNNVKNSLDVDIDGAKYEQAINENDIETAQQLVDKAAVEWGALTNIDGSPLRLYHGTTNYEEKSIWNKETKTFDTDYKKFTVFKNLYDNQTGYFFSSDKDNAGGYGSSIYEVYMKMNKPLTIDCDKSNYSAITYKDQIKDTYGWAEYAQSNGFDGVIFKNISDGAGFSDLQNITDDYVVFNSSQIKSAEAITYDNTGKVIPLNKRFGFYQDIRYSKDVDFSYDTLVNKPDMEITVINDKKIYQATKEGRKNLVNSALRSALSVGFKNESGNTFVHVDDIDSDVLVSKKGLRHSLDRRFNILAPVTENIGDILKNSIKINELTPQFDLIEKSYVLIGVAKNNENEPYIVSFVVNRASNEVTNVNVLYAVNAKTEPAGSLSPELSSQSDVSLTGSKISISDLLNYVNRYYPDVLPEDVLKHYGYESRPDGKLGESALYSKDVDFSQSEIESLKDENSTLRSENMYLATINEELKTGFKLTGGRVINPRLAKVVAQRIKETWNTTLSSDDIAEMVRQISVRHQNDADFNWNVLLAECKAIAQDVWNNRKNEITAEGKEILAEIRKTKVSLDYIQKSKIANYYGSYDVFRKKNFGSVLFSKDGVPIETQWLKWCEQFPDYFDASVSYELQPLVLEDIVESIKSAGNADYGFVENEAVTSMAYELADAYLDVPTRVKYDDKKQYEINKSRFEAKKALAKLKEQNRLEYENDIADVKEKLESKKDKNIAEYKARQRALQKRRDRRLKSEYKNRIKKKLYTIARIGATQSQKLHIPGGIIDSVKQIVNAIELGYGSKAENKAFINNMNNFANAFQSLSKDEYYGALVDTFNELTSDMLTHLNETLGNKTVKEMTADEMRQVDEILSITLQSISNMNKTFVAGRNATISGLANDVSNELSEYNNGKTLKGLPGGYVYNSFKPLYFFRNLGSDTLTELYNNLRKGEDTWARTVYEAKKYINSIRNEYNYKKWDFKNPIKFTSEYGEELELSLQNVMSIYALSRRDQGMQHLTIGGYVLKNAVENTNGKGKVKEKLSLFEKNDTAVQHRLTVGDVHSIITKLTTEQVEYVKALQSYLSNEMGTKGNEISKDLWDIELFNEKAYFPIKVWKEALGKQVQKKDEIQVSGKLKNASFTKKLVPNANMPVIIDDFDSVCAQHINDMASYHAFVLPLEDFQRVFGYKAKQDDEGMFMNPAVALKQAYGGKALEYINTLVNTVNSKYVVMSPVSTFGKLISNYKKAAVLANISVIVQQPTAIWRAMAYINPKYFAKTASGKILFKKYYDEAKQYAPVYIIKELGYFDTNMSKTAEDFLNQYDYQGLEKVKAFITDKTFRDDVFGYGASKADEATWAYIWLACKSEAKAKYSNLSEEEQLIKAGEKATEVITKTQVYDSVFSRSGFMRDSDRLGSMMSAFMAEPTVNMNMAYDAIVQLKRRKISKKQFTAIAASLVTQAIFNGLARNLVVALRDDDEDKTYLEKFFGNLPASILDGFNPVKSLILFKDIYSILQGYDVTRSDLDGIANAVAKIMYDFTHKDDIDPVDATIDIATSILAVFGAPYKNVYRDVKAFVTTVKTDKKLKKEESDKLSSVAVEEKVVDSILGGVPLRDLFMTLKKSDEYKYAHALAEDNDEKAKAIKEHWLEKNPDKTSDDFDNRMVTYLAENDKRIISAVSDRNSMKTSSYEKTVLEMIYEGYSDQIIYDAVDKIDKKVRSAAQDSIDGDTLEYDKKVNELLMLGYDKELLDEHIEKISELLNETSDSETVKGKYDADDLFNVWMTKGDTSSEYKSVYKDIIDTYVANGKTEERAEELAIDAINKRYKKVNDNFELSSMAYEQGNMQSYRNYINRISADGKYSQTEVAKMASGHETQNGTIWHLVDYAKAVYYGSYADTVYNELIASGVEEKSIRSSTTSYFRDKYKKATSQWQRQNIINKMYKTGLYNSSDINRYVNNWNE